MALSGDLCYKYPKWSPSLLLALGSVEGSMELKERREM
jgi:hypothetical protein